MDENNLQQRPIWMPALGVMASFGWFGFCGWYIQRNFGFEYFGYSLPHEQGLLLIALFAPVCFIWLMILYHQRAKVSSAELERVMARFEALDVKPDEHQEQIEGVTANLREQVKLLTEASEAAAGAAEAGGETIASRIAELKEAGEAITKRSDALQAALKQPLEDFANLNEKLSVLVRDSEAEIEKQGAAAQAAVVDAQGQVHEIAKELGLSTEKLQQGSGEAAARARQAGEEITKFTKELTATLKTFAESSADLRDTLKSDTAAIREGEAELLAGAKELQRMTQAATKALQETGTQTMGHTQTLKHQLEEASAQVESWKSGLTGSNEEMRGQIKALVDDLSGEAEKIGERLTAPGLTLSATLEELRQRTLRLEEAAAKAGERAEVLQRADLEARTEYFMRHAVTVLSDLNGTAFELSKFLEQEVPRDLLKQYKAGDRSVFARRLARSPQYYVPEIRRRFEEDAGFRQATGHFIMRFEDLLSRAAACDPDNTLSSAFLTADAGKIYMLLARSIGSRA